MAENCSVDLKSYRVNELTAVKNTVGIGKQVS